MPINTTAGPIERGPGAGHVINTSRIVEEDLQYTDEPPEIVEVLPAAGWCAVVGGEAVALVAFVALDSGRMYGVAVGENGRIALTEDVEKLPAFSGYVQTNNEPKENN
jgi:hypothetical protein